MKLSVLRKMVLRRDSPIGLYLRLNLSKRWNESVCACELLAASSYSAQGVLDAMAVAGVPAYVHV